MPFMSENELERALLKAVKNPAAAQEFYRLLLESDLLVLGSAEGREDALDKFNLAAGAKLNLVPGIRDNGKFLPVFSSLPRMQAYVKEESKYLAINGRALLDLTRGAPVLLNPGSEYGKEFSAREIAQLLDGSAPRGEARVLTGEAEYPKALVDALTGLFASRPDIAAARIIQITFAGNAGEPHPLVGIEMESQTAIDWPGLLRAIEAATAPAVPGLVFDIQRIDRQNPTGMTGALLQAPPFYQRHTSSGGSTLN